MSLHVKNRPNKGGQYGSVSADTGTGYSRPSRSKQFISLSSSSAPLTATATSGFSSFYTPSIKSLASLQNKVLFFLVGFCLLWLYIVFRYSGVYPLHLHQLLGGSEELSTSTSGSLPSQSFLYTDYKPSRAVHEPTPPRLLLDKGKKPVESSGRQYDLSNSKCPGGFKAMTYASHGGKDDRFCRSVESAIRNEIPLQILGWGVPWEGLSQKLSASYDAVKDLPDDCLVMFTDGFDVLFTDTSENIIQEFNDLNVPLLFSGECGCWPQLQRGVDVCLRKYPSSPTLYRFLNSGSWMGKAKYAAELLKEVMEDAIKSVETQGEHSSRRNNAKKNIRKSSSFSSSDTSSSNTMTDKLKLVHNLNDQELISDFYMQGKGNITLDHYARIFQSVHSTDSPLPSCKPRADLQVISGPHGLGYWFNKYTKSYPKVLHFNGGGKRHHLEMESKMWYRNPQNENINPSILTQEKGMEKVRKTKLLFNNRYGEFQEICPQSKDQP